MKRISRYLGKMEHYVEVAHLNEVRQLGTLLPSSVAQKPFGLTRLQANLPQPIDLLQDQQMGHTKADFCNPKVAFYPGPRAHNCPVLVETRYGGSREKNGSYRV